MSTHNPWVVAGQSPGYGWTRLARGLHYQGPPTGDLCIRVLAWQRILRDTGAFTHLTSALLRGWWMPPLPAELPVWVVQSAAQNESERPGLKVIRRAVAPDTVLVDGVVHTRPAETLVHCALDMGVLDVVVMADSALRNGDVRLGELEAVARQRRRGAPKLRQALPLLDARSESPWESLLRVLHLVCGIDVEPQREFYDASGFVARADLWLVGTSMIHEYDGAVHLTSDAQRSDLRRLRRLTNARLQRRGYVADDLLTRAGAILRDADQAIGRPHDPGRVGAWYALLNDSLFSSSGFARFCARLERFPHRKLVA